MKMKNFIFISALILSLLLFGCGENDSASVSGTLPGSSGGGGGDIIDPPAEEPTDDTSPVSAVLLETNASTIGPGELALITATLYNSSGQRIGGEKEVTVTLDDPTLGSIAGTWTVTDGTGSNYFTARGNEGTVTINARADGASSSQTIVISNLEAADSVVVTVDSSDISIGENITVTATVENASGAFVEDGTTVAFSTTLGQISASDSTVNGVATATYEALQTGSATITATAGSAQGTAQISVTEVPLEDRFVQWVSASPQIIRLAGSGSQETSEITFLVSDSNGPITDSQEVFIEVSGPGGGEYLSSTTVGTVAGGLAKTILHSGAIPGPASITARIFAEDGTELSLGRGTVVIGGGIPSAQHFSLSADVLNLEGLAYDNIKDNILTLVADRYGDKEVLEGTSVAYYSECGAINSGVSLDAIGEGSVEFRTQDPPPQDVTPDALNTPFGSGSCGEYCDEENAFISQFYDDLNIDITLGSNNPRDGLCTIIAVVDGEEEFTDNNGNGAYDEADDEPFVDTYDDVHLDMDDDSLSLDSVGTGNPYDAAFEDLIVDRGDDGGFTGKNLEWDDNKRIAKRINLLYTGVPVLTLSDYVISVPNDGSQEIFFSLHDANYNPPIGGTTLEVKFTGAASVTGTTSLTYLDTNSIGAPIYSVIITDNDPDTDDTTIAEMVFTYNWRGNEFKFTIGGNTDEAPAP